jgi:hypothetical protein
MPDFRLRNASACEDRRRAGVAACPTNDLPLFGVRIAKSVYSGFMASMGVMLKLTDSCAGLPDGRAGRRLKISGGRHESLKQPRRAK